VFLPRSTLTVFDSFSPIAAISPIPNSTFTAFCQENHITLSTADRGSLQAHLAEIWGEYKAFIFLLATGAVVRLIAPLLQDKASDPAVIVLDPTLKFAISLCGGHGGNGDRLATLIARQLEATPLITNASTGLGLLEIDLLGLPYGWKKGTGDWTGVSGAIARSAPVQVIQEAGSTLWRDRLAVDHPFDLDREEGTYQGRVWIGFSHRQFHPQSSLPKVQWHPRVLWVGIGCIRGTTKEVIETAIATVFKRYHLALEAIAGLTSIDLKADEPGLLEYCQARNFPLKTFPAEALQGIEVPNPSPVVAEEVGTPSVAEASALKMGETLLVPKQIESQSVTVAVSLAEREYIGCEGQLWLVGTGPGRLDQMTSAAKAALSQADVIIGYSLYIDLIRPLLRPHQRVEALPITQERERAIRAIDLARWGLTVGVISSGDAGIYGMAGLVLEQLQGTGWDGNSPKVQVFPGITAMQGLAARIGAPLMHDFCAISLSDLLTPWEVIVKRLTAAAMGDFVTGLYNPRSNTRTTQIITAREIFLKYRDPKTPVAIARNVYRESEEITLTTLEEMLTSAIDMLTVILIGNSNTRRHGDWLITPRGYKIGQELGGDGE
jgi:cobalt-precorrin 5A hydrolase/precorrin-3B C17-methyltransferase